jgi:hypothetical protein
MMWMGNHEPWRMHSNTPFDEIERKKKVKEANGKRKAIETFLRLKLKRKKK